MDQASIYGVFTKMYRVSLTSKLKGIGMGLSAIKEIEHISKPDGKILSSKKITF